MSLIVPPETPSLTLHIRFTLLEPFTLALKLKVPSCLTPIVLGTMVTETDDVPGALDTGLVVAMAVPFPALQPASNPATEIAKTRQIPFMADYLPGKMSELRTQYSMANPR
ncbi:hypothetical protein SBA5_830005 [Candidatus Sulfotelmatomonas gaucii]|uniref:Uncharacterized protein n=1 Tax=Candidatus Sulfuritelmatomonas gaucii TaxID=2043161 RepID=A0A2N9M6M2_9BACT|nr:hypothetical protein SBA5_830005 [Candidatus Sulfotelmatomonas gaucii]